MDSDEDEFVFVTLEECSCKASDPCLTQVTPPNNDSDTCSPTTPSPLPSHSLPSIVSLILPTPPPPPDERNALKSFAEEEKDERILYLPNEGDNDDSETEQSEEIEMDDDDLSDLSHGSMWWIDFWCKEWWLPNPQEWDDYSNACIPRRLWSKKHGLRKKGAKFRHHHKH